MRGIGHVLANENSASSVGTIDHTRKGGGVNLAPNQFCSIGMSLVTGEKQAHNTATKTRSRSDHSAK
jgi:hypothetical protein